MGFLDKISEKADNFFAPDPTGKFVRYRKKGEKFPIFWGTRFDHIEKPDGRIYFDMGRQHGSEGVRVKAAEAQRIWNEKKEAEERMREERMRARLQFERAMRAARQSGGGHFPPLPPDGGLDVGGPPRGPGQGGGIPRIPSTLGSPGGHEENRGRRPRRREPRIEREVSDAEEDRGRSWHGVDEEPGDHGEDDAYVSDGGFQGDTDPPAQANGHFDSRAEGRRRQRAQEERWQGTPMGWDRNAGGRGGRSAARMERPPSRGYENGWNRA